MVKKHSREKQAQVLRRTQAKRKEQKKEQVLKAIQEILKQKKPLTFKNIATFAGCSISYLYKWDEIKAYIHELQQKKETTLNPIEEDNKHQPHSLKTLHEVAKQRIRDLETTIRELKLQNEKLRGHVTEIYELRDECQRLRTQLRELTSPTPSSKLIPIQASTKKTIQPSPTNKRCDPVSPTDASGSAPRQESIEEIIESIKGMGIKVGTKLKQEITNRDPRENPDARRTGFPTFWVWSPSFFGKWGQITPFLSTKLLMQLYFLGVICRRRGLVSLVYQWESPFFLLF